MILGHKMEEKRGNQRQALDTVLTAIDTLSGKEIGCIKNISKEGVLLCTHNPLSINEFQLIKLDLPPALAQSTGASQARLTLNIRWVKPDRHSNMSLAGCLIINSQPPVDHWLESLLELA
ncbi:MAG: hypothetical protein D6B26_04880 [Spirochaetaceae bacterium]|nr:MAG: hypothetical protein D6B26_04880 [Spirochaetaceae bacterium]